MQKLTQFSILDQTTSLVQRSISHIFPVMSVPRSLFSHELIILSICQMLRRKNEHIKHPNVCSTLHESVMSNYTRLSQKSRFLLINKHN